MKSKGLASSVGSRIRSLRKGLKLTQVQLATRAGLSWKYMGELENGRRDVRLNTLARLAKTLGVKPAELFRFTEEDAALVQVADLLKGRDEVFRAQLVRVVRDVLLLVEAAK